MAIRTDFLIKHVRPIGTGYEAYCNNDMIDLLVNGLNFTHQQVAQIFAAWRTTAEADPHGQSYLFVQAAEAVALARWQQLYQTEKSTIMFLDADQLVSLSDAGAAAGANANFNWRTNEELAISVTITQQGNHHIIWDGEGCSAKTDANSNVFHFYDLLT